MELVGRVAGLLAGGLLLAAITLRLRSRRLRWALLVLYGVVAAVGYCVHKLPSGPLRALLGVCASWSQPQYRLWQEESSAVITELSSDCSARRDVASPVKFGSVTVHPAAEAAIAKVVASHPAGGLVSLYQHLHGSSPMAEFYQASDPNSPGGGRCRVFFGAWATTDGYILPSRSLSPGCKLGTAPCQAVLNGGCP